jgi:hypothetical protein
MSSKFINIYELHQGEAAARILTTKAKVPETRKYQVSMDVAHLGAVKAIDKDEVGCLILGLIFDRLDCVNLCKCALG